MIADLEFVDARAEFGDDTCCLMTDDHGCRLGALSVDRDQVGVAKASGFDLHENFAGVWRVKFDLIDTERQAFRIRARLCILPQDSSFNLHCLTPDIADL